MDTQLLFKIFILLLLLAILVSLASGMFFLITDKGKKNRTLTSLKFRVALSVLLFISLLIGYQFDLIRPHNIVPVQIEKAP